MIQRLLLAAGAALLLAPAVANADSIVYIDQGNVWSAEPGRRRTRSSSPPGGQWHSPTQADDGTIAAVQGTGADHGDGAATAGRCTRSPRRPTKSGDGGTFAPRPVQLSFSPDGSEIAYSYVAYSCPVASTCGSIQRSTFYTDANVSDATPMSVYGNQFSVVRPGVGDQSNVARWSFGGFGRQVAIDDLGAGRVRQRAPWRRASSRASCSATMSDVPAPSDDGSTPCDRGATHGAPGRAPIAEQRTPTTGRTPGDVGHAPDTPRSPARLARRCGRRTCRRLGPADAREHGAARERPPRDQSDRRAGRTATVSVVTAGSAHSATGIRRARATGQRADGS